MSDLDVPGPFGAPSTRDLLDLGIRHYNFADAPTAGEMARWHNEMQREALARPFGIPVLMSSDPRHAFTENPAMSHPVGPFSQWPEPLGLAAIGSDELVGEWASIVRDEYLAVGLRVALHPQVDLATEPRWTRVSGTFGEDVETVERLLVPYLEGLQGTELGPRSVSAMAKHYPGAGPQRDGLDPHFPESREQVYPGDRFRLHLRPFATAIEAGVTQLMPYYGLPVGAGVEEVGFSFNREVLTDVLRDELGYAGIVCADWWAPSRMPWGVEHLSYEDRLVQAIDAGVDQFGGEWRADVLLGLVESGRISERRVDVSVTRVLELMFRLGVFDEPFVDADAADAAVGRAPAREAGRRAQAAAHVLLEHAASGPARLPLGRGLRLYVEGMDPHAVDEFAEVVDDATQADVAVVRLVAPWEDFGDPGDLRSWFHSGSLDFSEQAIAHLRAIAAHVPVVVDVYLDRPAILAPIAEIATTLLVNFGATDGAVADVLFGAVRPEGRLPVEVPRSMEAVRASRSDVPFDSEAPRYPFGYGLELG
ncbi:glycoside hydrolase family 3 protein [Agromyces mangrovi Wang et al. 2018]|uniref:glycoside hydrolase family 3 protein n=1 Tax=Agromyces mangrovi TaxID=1858653 RepID=UPI0025746F32|nr:glycoside hydrolase family 3 protein [Agromyces mangrovi]